MINGTDRSNLVGGLIREAAWRSMRGGRVSLGSFSAAIGEIYPQQNGFGQVEIIEPLTNTPLHRAIGESYGYDTSPWYRDVWDFVRGINWNIGAGPPNAMQTSRMQPNFQRGMPQLMGGGGGCSFYQKRSQFGCETDPVIIGLLVAGGILAIKIIK